MILLEELVKRGLIREDQVPEIVKTAEDKYEGNIDQALLSYSVNEDAILELKSTVFNIPIRKVDPGTITSLFVLELSMVL
jgi:hypothetical protein